LPDGNFEYDSITQPCLTETLTHLLPFHSYKNRLLPFNTKEHNDYKVFFPKGNIRNVLARTCQRSRYLETTGYLEALDFEWGFPNDTGYILNIKVGPLRTSLPSIWWIQQQTTSLLGYHKHFLHTLINRQPEKFIHMLKTTVIIMDKANMSKFHTHNIFANVLQKHL